MTAQERGLEPSERTVAVNAEALDAMLNEHWFDCDHIGECPREALLRALREQTP